MMRINKFSIGIRPVSKIFRMTSLSGLIIDKILSERESNKHLDEKYYTQIARNNETGNYKLYNEELGNELNLDLDNVVFIKDYYKSAKTFSLNKVLTEFKQIWTIVNDILKLKDIRRIGMVAEHQIDIDEANVNKKLIESLTTFNKTTHPAKFLLRFENRYPTKEGIAPDIKKSDFVNVIQDIYDSEFGTENPQKGSFNANIDIQRYYSPLLKANVVEEVKKLNKTFIKETKKFESFLREKGLTV